MAQCKTRHNLVAGGRPRNSPICASPVESVDPNPGVAQVVYPAGVSDKPPQTYILHTVVLFVVIVAAMVTFLMHQWG